jgi:site-specific DNA recombinase
MKTISYSRVSTTDQAENGVSLDVQRAKIAAYAELYNLDIVECIEDDESGKSLKRPGIQRALAMLRSGEVQGIIIHKLDRLSRCVADWSYLVEKYFGEKGGKSLFSVQDSIDTRTAAGKLVLNILVSVAEWERAVIGERTKAALQHKRSKGERVGAVPFGFDLASDGIALLPNSVEQDVLAKIAELRAGGMSSRHIAAELSRLGCKTKKGKDTWNHTSVERILKRQAVAA